MSRYGFVVSASRPEVAKDKFDNVGMTTDGAGWIWYNMRRLGKQSGKEKPHYG